METYLTFTPCHNFLLDNPMAKISSRSIPKFTREANYGVDVGWNFLLKFLEQEIGDGLDLDPDFQRAHVWTREQQVRYIEFVMRGGTSGNVIQTNCPGYQKGDKRGPYVLVDGKQRLNAVVSFLNNEFRIFEGEPYGGFCGDYDRLDMLIARFRWNVNDLGSRAEVLQWYLDLNTGGTIHTNDEIEKVRKMLEAEK
jgi:hypothetical protein